VETAPKFVNLQDGLVSIPDERGRTITVIPWAKRKDDNDPDCVVVGNYYQQFVSGRGPLYPFPVASPRTAPAIAPVAAPVCKPAPIAAEATAHVADSVGVPNPTVRPTTRKKPSDALKELGFPDSFIGEYETRLESVLMAAQIYRARGTSVEEAMRQIEQDFAFESTGDEAEAAPPPAPKGRLGRKR
jgi:hypothetical protein